MKRLYRALWVCAALWVVSPAAQADAASPAWVEEFASPDALRQWSAAQGSMSVANGRATFDLRGLHGRSTVISGELAADFRLPVVLAVKVDEVTEKAALTVVDAAGADEPCLLSAIVRPGVYAVNLQEATGWNQVRKFRIGIGVADTAKTARLTIDWLRIGTTSFDPPRELLRAPAGRPPCVNRWRDDFFSADSKANWQPAGGILELADGKGVLTHHGEVGGVLCQPITMDFDKPVIFAIKVDDAALNYLVKVYEVASRGEGWQILGDSNRLGYRSVDLTERLGWKGMRTFRVLVAGTGTEKSDKIRIDYVEIGPPRDYRARPIAALPPNRLPLRPGAFVALPLGAVKPAGWLRRQLEVQAAGLSGHLDEFWRPGDFAHGANGWEGGPGDCWEDGPYYLDGIVPLAYLLDDQHLLKKVARRVEWAIQSQEPNGQFGPTRGQQANDWWPRIPVLKALANYYEATGDQRVLDLMKNYFRYQLKELPARRLKGSKDIDRARAQDYLVAVYWLYNLTGEPWLLELGNLLRAQMIDWIAALDEEVLAKFQSAQGLKTRRADTHGVNISMGVKFPAVVWQQSGDPSDRQAARRCMESLLRHHGEPYGVFSADEHLHGTSPVRGTELCAVVELMYSMEETVRILGDPFLADGLETAAYNALPAAIKSDAWAHQYIQQANQVPASRVDSETMRTLWTNVKETARTFGVGPSYKCCLLNFHQGWPKFVKSLVMATPDGGVAAIAYGPCTVETRVAGGARLWLTEKTGYPFDEEVRFEIGLSEPARFPLVLRIPGWAEGAENAINGRPQPAPRPGTFHRIERLWQDGDQVLLRFPMKVRVVPGHEGLVSVYRGPLLYASQIGERWTEYAGRPPHADWEVFPTTPWNYAILLDRHGRPVNLKVEKPALGDQHYKGCQAPVRLRLHARRLPQWGVEHQSPAVIAAKQQSLQPVEEITLVPYGHTNIRIAVFPWVEGP